MNRVRRTREAVREEPVKVSVTVTPFKGADTKTTEKVIQVHQFITEPAYVRVGAGVTKSTGNYESLRVDVAITVPCYIEQIKQTAKEAAEFVATTLDKEIDEYLGDL
jgi:hypothetical protein